MEKGAMNAGSDIFGGKLHQQENFILVIKRVQWIPQLSGGVAILESPTPWPPMSTHRQKRPHSGGLVLQHPEAPAFSRDQRGHILVLALTCTFS